MAWLSPAPSLRPKSVTALPHASPDPHVLIYALLSAPTQAVFTGETDSTLKGHRTSFAENAEPYCTTLAVFWNSGFRQNQAALLVWGSLPWSCGHVCVHSSPSISSRGPQLPFHPPCPSANTGLTPTEGAQPLGAHAALPEAQGLTQADLQNAQTPTQAC